MKVWIRWAGSDIAFDAFTPGERKRYDFSDQRSRFGVGDIAFLVFGPVDDPEAGNIRGWERVVEASGHQWTTEIGGMFGQKFHGRELRLLPQWRVLRGPRHLDATGQPENSREVPADALHPFLQFIRDTGERLPPELLGMAVAPPVAKAIPLQTYVTGAFLNEGVFGKVYRGFDPVLERPVALKFLKVDARSAIELRRQAAALAKVRHPNVLTIYSLGNARDPDTNALDQCIVMELLEGATDLEEALQTGVTQERGTQWAKEVLLGLCAIHDAGLQHGDIHDGNILIVPEGVKIIDIHILESIANRSTRTRESAIRADLAGALLVARGALIAVGFEVATVERFQKKARAARTMSAVLQALEEILLPSPHPTAPPLVAPRGTPSRGHPPDRIAYWKAKLAEWSHRRVIVRDAEYDTYPTVQVPENYPPNRPSPWFRVTLWEVSDQGPVFAGTADYVLHLLTWNAIESVSFAGDEYYGEPNIIYRYSANTYFDVGQTKHPAASRGPKGQ